MKRSMAAAAVAGLMLSGVLVASQSAQAVPAKPEKVTICHRTHSVTNPYRMITVSKNSVDGPLNVRSSGNPSSSAGDHAGYVHNGYHRSGNSYVRDYPSNPRVFSSTFAYSGPNKVWEDIIPSFTKLSGSTTVTYNGVNWDAAGKAIYFGTGSSFGACKKMTAREFYDSEVAAGQTPTNIFNEIRDQAADEDGGINPTKLSDLPSEPSHPKGPTPPASVASDSQKIHGHVWEDADHDGLEGGSESKMSGVTVTLLDASGATLATTTTDSNGDFSFSSVDEGLYKVNYTLPSLFSYTYDSTTASDGNTTVNVPSGGSGFSWAGLILTSAGFTAPTFTEPVANSSGSSSSSGSSAAATSSAASSSSSASGSLANTGLSVSLSIVLGATGAIVVGAGALALTRRRRESLR